MSEEQFANQSEQTQVETQQEQLQIQPETVSTPDNYFTVKYNKEERQVSYDEAPDYIQKGLNYDKVQQKAESYQQQLDRAARLAGYQSHDELIQALDQLEKEQEREQYRQKGVDPDVLDEVLSKRLEDHPDVQYAREFRQKQQEEQQFNAEVDALFKAFPDLKPEQIPQEVLSLRSEGLPLVHAYRSYMFDNVKAQSEQEAIRKIQQNQQSSTGSLSGGDVDHKTGVKNMSSSEFEAYVRKVKNGEIRQI